MKKILLLLVAVLSFMTISAQTSVTFNPADQTAVDNTEWTITDASGIVTATCSSGTISASQFRIFKGQTLTISVPDGSTITGVEFTCTASGTSKYGPGCFEASTGTYTYAEKVGTWTGSTTSVVFTASSNQVRATQIVVTYVAGEQPAVANPTFSPDEGTYYDSIAVSLSCTTEGAVIYYRVNDDYIWNPFSEPIPLTATSTVEAYSEKDEKYGDKVVSATYTIKSSTKVASISAALENIDSVVRFTNPVTVVYQSGYYTYAKDDTGVMLIYGSVPTYKNGDVIPAGFYGKMTVYRGLTELTTSISTGLYSSDSFAESTENNGTVTPTVYNISDITADLQNVYAKFRNVTYNADTKAIYNEAGDSLAIYSRFSGVTLPETGIYHVTGFVSVYNTTVQLYPTEFATPETVTNITPSAYYYNNLESFSYLPNAGTGANFNGNYTTPIYQNIGGPDYWDNGLVGVTGGQFGNTAQPYFTNLQAGTSLVQLGGTAGKVLCISGANSNINAAMKELYGLDMDIPCCSGSLNWFNINWFMDPNNTPTGTPEGDAVYPEDNIRVRITMNIYSNTMSADNVINKAYLQDNQNLPRPNSTVANSSTVAAVTPADFIKYQSDGVTPETDANGNNVWDPTKWLVYEVDGYCPVIETDTAGVAIDYSPLRLKMEMYADGLASATLFIKSVEFFEIANNSDPIAPTTRTRTYETYELSPVSGVATVGADEAVEYTVNGQEVTFAEDAVIYTLAGGRVAEAEAGVAETLDKGFYIAKVGDKGVKFVIR